MIEQLNRQRVFKLLEAYSAGDFDAALLNCSDDIVHLASAPIDIFPHLGSRQGKAEVKKMWEIARRRYSGMRYEIKTILAEGDQVAVDLRVFLRKCSNDRIVQYDVAIFYTLQDGRVTRIREIMDTFDLVQQVLERDLASLLNISAPLEP